MKILKLNLHLRFSVSHKMQFPGEERQPGCQFPGDGIQSGTSWTYTKQYSTVLLKGQGQQIFTN